MARSILIADNNAFYRQVLGDFFRFEGYEVAVAADGVEALERLTAGGIDVVLLDLIMPRIDGARLCRFIKSHERLRMVPVVILSGILADEIEGFESIGADAYVAKMPMDKLQITLRKVFDDLAAGRGNPVVVGFDNMYRREVVLELLEERRARDVIQNALTEGIVELSDERRILRSNRAFERMMGRTGSELLSLPIEEIFEESREAIAALFASLEGQAGDLAGAVVRRLGRSLRLRVHPLAERERSSAALHPVLRRIAEENPKVKILQPGSLPGYVLLVEDVTDQVRTQEERDQFRERVARSEKMSALGLFVAGAAHELNNPLTAVLGYAQLLGAKNLPADLRQHLRKIEEGALRCKSVVENLLVFTHRGRAERRLATVGDLVDSAMTEVAARAATSSVQVTRDLPPSLPPIEVGGTEIVQALAAVLDNAIRAAAERPEPRRVSVRGREAEGYLILEVADSGAGIHPSIIERIFDPFFTTREVGQGKGLGLSVAYGVVRAHSGQIRAANAPEGGAVVTIRLPAARSAEPAAAPTSAGARGARILVVDDEPVVLDLITDALASEHRIETAMNGREGLVMAGRQPYDVILLDMKMPDLTGRQMYEALAALRPEMADRVIFTTGDTVQEETRRFLESVSNPCLSKPFSLDALHEAVERMLAAARPV